MNFPSELIPATLIKRYKRFLADVQLEDGTLTTVHCPNPGAMLGLNKPGSRVWISDSGNPTRKLRHTFELLHTGKTLVGINTNSANRLAREAMQGGLVPGVDGAAKVTPEQKYGENSRIDFLVEAEGKPPLFIEVKNVHFLRSRGLHEFPDSPTARGTKHLGELTRQIEMGNRAMMLYLIQRNDGDRFRIAADMDPAYGKAFKVAVEAGVMVAAIRCSISLDKITPECAVTVEI
jgi:sugar fermentation stimulation protein A